MLRQIAVALTIGATLLGSGAVTAQTPQREVDRLIASDDAVDCDRVGWSVSADDLRAMDAGTLSPAWVKHHYACDTVRRFSMTGLCGFPLWVTADGTTTSPDQAVEFWVTCVVKVFNDGSEDMKVLPTDFAMVDANNTRYAVEDSITEREAGDTNMLKAALLPAGQNTFGIISFALPLDNLTPLRIEWQPSEALGFPLVIIVEDYIDWGQATQ